MRYFVSVGAKTFEAVLGREPSGQRDELQQRRAPLDLEDARPAHGPCLHVQGVEGLAITVRLRPSRFAS